MNFLLLLYIVLALKNSLSFIKIGVTVYQRVRLSYKQYIYINWWMNSHYNNQNKKDLRLENLRVFKFNSNNVRLKFSMKDIFS